MLKVSTLAQEGACKISKTIKLPLLLDSQEMRALLDMLGPIFFFETGGILEKEKGILFKPEFTSLYSEYLDCLKRGEIPPLKKFYSPFSAALSCTPDFLYSVVVDENRHLIKVRKPIIQLQVNQIQYSNEDGSFRSLVYSEDAITWGVQFSYPQIYQDPHTQEIYDVDQSPLFPNTAVFRTLQKWVRDHTVATPFVFEGRRINVPIRLGKECFTWINRHPQLVQRGISVRALA